ncbi:hybrid-cluster NAD(P)-dependent oxidoreductase [Gordonia asplenii]|nr:hybrid-cluster NAD(P)-dependent oxidoreductase [Gordonia asplenii]
MTIAELERMEAELLAPTIVECWSEDSRVELTCIAVRDITHDIKSFVFAPPPGQVFRHEPGQFLTLCLQIDGAHIERCYTISSPPTRPHRISITVKRVPGGPVSNWLHDNLRAGMSVLVAAPGGAFTLTSPLAPKYLFLSAGSGVTPLMSMTRTLVDLGADADVAFVHSARTPVDIVFRQELAGIAADQAGIHVTNVCEDHHPSEIWTGPRGRLSTGLLSALVPDLHERIVYTCGPAPYMASVRQILTDVGFDMDRYHEESFSFDVPVSTPAPPDASSGPATVGYSVEFVKRGQTITCGPDQSVLDAALAAGVRLASACGQGMCGTCKVGLLDGAVDMEHQGGIRPREIRDGKILVCCSRPLGDLKIDI